MTEESFVRELERRADRVHVAPLFLDDVRGKAHAIRRRRRAGAAAAVAAAVAVVAVAPSVLWGGDDTRRDVPEPAPSPPGHSAVLHDGQVTLPDGHTVDIELDTEDVTQLGVLTDGRIVVATSRPQAIQVFSPDGDLAHRYRVPVNALTMSPTDDLVAWADESFRIQVLESGVAEPVGLSGIPLPGESFPLIDAVVGSGCADGGCTAWGGDGTTTSAAATTEGPRDLETSEPLRIEDVSPDGEQWAVSFPPGPDQQFGCSGLYDVETNRILARNCDTSGLRFAPDGQHLFGMRGDNDMYGHVEVYDQDLRQPVVYDPGDQVVIKDVAWADESNLLVVTAGLTGRPQWSLVRVSIDGGDPETVVGPVDGPHAELPSVFRLSE